MNQDIKYLHPEIQRLLQYLNLIPAINQGGCAIAVLAIYKKAQQIGLDAQMVYRYRDYYSDHFDTNSSVENGEAINPVSCNHATIYVEGLHISVPYRNGDESNRYDYRHSVSEQTVIQSLMNPDANWNKSFNRALFLPQIERFLGLKLLPTDEDIIHDKIEYYERACQETMGIFDPA